MTQATDLIQRAVAALEPLYDRLDAHTIESAKERHALLAHAIKAIRLAEERLTEALNSEPLRGLPNLLTSTQPVYGLHVRKIADKGSKVFLKPGEDRLFLLLTPTGTLNSFSIRRDSSDLEDLRGDRVGRNREITLHVEGRPAHDKDFRIDDLPLVLSTVVEAIERHLEHCETMTTRNQKLRALADTVIRVLG